MALKKINIDEYDVTEDKMVDFFKEEKAVFYWNENTRALYERCPYERKYHWIGYATKKI